MATPLPRSLRLQDFDLRQIRGVSQARALYRFIAGYRAVYLAALVAMAIAGFARSQFATVIRLFTDDVLLAQNFADLHWYGLAFLGLAAVAGGCTFWGGRQAARTAEGAVRRLRVFLYDHLQHLPFACHDRMQSGELIQRSSSDVEEIRRLLAEHFTGVGRILAISSMSFVAMFNLHARLALVSAIVIPVSVFLSTRFWRHLSQIFFDFQDQEARLSSMLQQNLYGARVVRAFARERHEISRFEVANETLLRRGKRLVRFHNIYWPSMDMLLATQMVGSLLLGSWMAVQGEISVGAYLAFVSLLSLMLGPIRHLGRIFALSAQSLVSLGRVRDIIAERREPLQAGDYRPAEPLRGDIRYEHVSFAYDALEFDAAEMRHPPVVLHDISFTAEAGQVVAILGSTGSGKTSVVNLLPRFYDATSGHIYLDGVDLTRYPRAVLRRHIGIVQQEPFLFGRTIRENIRYGAARDVSEAEIRNAARAANIHDNVMTFPQGYDTIVGEQGVTLSGGQRQRLAIARTILKDPEILILDDATSAVDAETERFIRDALRRLMQGRTTFVVAHRISSIATADKILVMDGGRIVQAGTHDELAAQAGPYRQVFQLQTSIETELAAELAMAAAPLPPQPNGQAPGLHMPKDRG